jgi:hypothetical protein
MAGKDRSQQFITGSHTGSILVADMPHSGIAQPRSQG